MEGLIRITKEFLAEAKEKPLTESSDDINKMFIKVLKDPKMTAKIVNPSPSSKIKGKIVEVYGPSVDTDNVYQCDITRLYMS